MFHSRFNRVLAVVTWLLCLSGVGAVILAGTQDALRYLPLAALVAWLTWAGLWHPTLRLDDEAITVVNTFATTVVPWAALINVDTKYALTLMTPRRRVVVTVAPAPGRIATALSNRDLKGISAPRGADGSMRPGDLPSTDSGAAAHLVRQRWESLLETGRIEVGTADEVRVDRRVHWPTIIVGCALGLAAVAALALN
ncbi:MAG: PH domain-containing protein [Salinibacterium sp.]|nr:PH domain-containing protein [Cryobacterium sp.]MCB1280661.1 PH domain-containing protein [Salinibacterium sp.]